MHAGEATLGHEGPRVGWRLRQGRGLLPGQVGCHLNPVTLTAPKRVWELGLWGSREVEEGRGAAETHSHSPTSPPDIPFPSTLHCHTLAGTLLWGLGTRLGPSRTPEACTSPPPVSSSLGPGTPLPALLPVCRLQHPHSSPKALG